MGGQVSCASKVDALSAVDQALADAQEEEKFTHKILLLGAGECGKSTVVKQIKMIWAGKEGMSAREKLEYTLAIRRNCIEAMQTLLEASRTLCVPLQNQGLEAAMHDILRLDTSATLTRELGEKVYSLWTDPGLQSVFARKDEFWNMDATPYYMNEVLRIADDDFEPTEEDAVMTRVRTTGIVVTQVTEDPYTYQIVDVGGQRSERRKWIHCFDDVRAIIFLEGLSGYNQVLFEDNSVNRMIESMNLFAEVVKNPIFQKTPIFVFLNKKDLFEEMIVKKPLTVCFPEYKGPPGEVQPALQYIEDRYNAIMQVCQVKFDFFISFQGENIHNLSVLLSSLSSFSVNV